MKYLISVHAYKQPEVTKNLVSFLKNLNFEFFFHLYFLLTAFSNIATFLYIRLSFLVSDWFKESI